jgi:haloalkane dehalogenase
VVTVREIVGWGVNDPGTDERAAYDFFCVYRVPSVEFQRAFEQKIGASGWYDYFYQVNISGAALSPRELLEQNVSMRAPKRQTVEQ